MLDDDTIPAALRDQFRAELGAFLLGHIAADARVENGTERANTHFYRYDQPMTLNPWRAMLQQYPALAAEGRTAARAFIAGYVAHLSVDERWAGAMLEAYFAGADHWGPREFRFFMLHILLIHMDERDYGALAGWQADARGRARPGGWSALINDESLNRWRDFLAGQLRDGSQTLIVLGERIGKTPAELRAVLDSDEIMTRDLWSHIPRAALAQVERELYEYARAQMLLYLG